MYMHKGMALYGVEMGAKDFVSSIEAVKNLFHCGSVDDSTQAFDGIYLDWSRRKITTDDEGQLPL